MRRVEEYWYKFKYSSAPEYGAGSRAWAVIYELVDCVKVAVILLVLALSFAARPVGISGDSMLPTLENGDWVFAVCAPTGAQRGDIVIIARPDTGAKPLVKRVIAVAGDEIDIDFSAGDVYVNGELISEPYIRAKTYLSYDVTFPLKVPQGKVFVMGDNRNESRDSRSSDIGLIDSHYILGKVKLRLLPFEYFESDSD